MNHLCGLTKQEVIRRITFIALKGVTPVYHRLLCRGERYDVICCNVIHLDTGIGTEKGICLCYDFLRDEPFPNMDSFPGPNSVAIMDNCSLHHGQEVKELNN